MKIKEAHKEFQECIGEKLRMTMTEWRMMANKPFLIQRDFVPAYFSYDGYLGNWRGVSCFVVPFREIEKRFSLGEEYFDEDYYDTWI